MLKQGRRTQPKKRGEEGEVSLSLSFLVSPFSSFLGFDKNDGEGAELTPWVALRNVKTSLEKTC